MSPDLEWRVDDPAGEQTIAKTSAPRPPRWRGWAIGLVVLLGIGLGLLYQSIPEPVKPTPTPTPLPTVTPTVMPVALYETIALEAQALAEGDRAALEHLIDANFEGYRALLDQIKAWGTPPDGPLYSIVDFRQPTDDLAWAEVRQFWHDRYVDETRFYRKRDGRWWRIEPTTDAFWSGQTETADTPHFRFTYAIEDRSLIAPIATLLEGDYEQLCTDLDCPTTPQTCVEALDKQWCSSFARTLTVTLDLRGPAGRNDVNFTEAGLSMGEPSPRTRIQLDPNDQGNVYLRNPITWLQMIRLVYGKTAYQDRPLPGIAVVEVIFFREYNQLLKRTNDKPVDLSFAGQWLDVKDGLPLDRLWKADGSDVSLYPVASVLLDFIEQENGWKTVVKLMKAIGTSQSMAETIETSTGVPYVEFEKQWQAWVITATPAAP